MQAIHYTTAELAERLGGTISGKSDLVLTGFASADDAGAGDLTFAENDQYFERAENSEASAILVAGDRQSSKKTVIQVSDARVAFAVVLPLFFPEIPAKPGLHPNATVDPTAEVDPSAQIGPGCVIGAGVRIGARSILDANVRVGAQSVLGVECRIQHGVAIYPSSKLGNRVRIHANSVIGADGFGYVLDEGYHKKVPQVGIVEIGDDVEIGAGTTIDRGALGTTRIGKGTKIDNLVQIGHNVVLGEHCILCAQVGIAGSTRVGDFVVMGGQVGVAGHLEIGDKVSIKAKAGVMHNIPSGQTWLGLPAQPDKSGKREVLAIKRLPELLRRVRALEDKS